jgi:hypothetical protein
MTDKLAKIIKMTYSKYHAGEISAEQALDYLEIAIADENE